MPNDKMSNEKKQHFLLVIGHWTIGVYLVIRN